MPSRIIIRRTLKNAVKTYLFSKIVLYFAKIPFTKEIEHRFEWGGVEIQLDMKGEYIRDCRIYSDALETEVFDVIEDLIKDHRYDSGDIRSLSSGLPEGTSATAYEILGLIAKSI